MYFLILMLLGSPQPIMIGGYPTEEACEAAAKSWKAGKHACIPMPQPAQPH